MMWMMEKAGNTAARHAYYNEVNRGEAAQRTAWLRQEGGAAAKDPLVTAKSYERVYRRGHHALPDGIYNAHDISAIREFFRNEYL